MDIKICVPSYKRDKVETLDLVPFARVYIDGSEEDRYREANPGADIVVCPNGVQGSLERVRNYILDTEFSNGADVVLLLDDDIQSIRRYEFEDGFLYNCVKLTPDDILPFVYKYSVMAEDLGAKMWGVQVVPDYRSYRASTPFGTVSYLGGPFQCFLKGCELRYDERMRLKEDYDMTLQQCNVYRKVLRVNYYSLIVKQSKQTGGCAVFRNREREELAINVLQKKWGGQIVRRDRSKSPLMKKERGFEDYNPIIKIPIPGI